MDKRASTPSLIATESQHQQALVNWWKIVHDRYHLPECALLKVKNESLGASKVAMARAKAEGLRKGASDLLLTVSRDGWHGLWIEMKKRDGRPSQEQILFLHEQRQCGYNGAICYGWEEARKTIEDYLA